MYSPERQKGITWSVVMHLAALLLAIFGLPAMLNHTPPEEPVAISVEILPISNVSNVKPSESQPAPKPEEKKPAEQKKPAPPVKTNDTPPPPKEEKPVPVPVPKKEEPKKPEEKKADKNKAKEEDLEAVLKAVRDTAQKESKNNSKDTSSSKDKTKSTHYDSSLPMSMSEKDAIVSQISQCWSPPAGAKDAADLVVLLEIDLAQDGTVLKVELANESKSRYTRDSFFRAAADSAMRAVRQCSPLKNLPPEKFGTWHSMELNFDPKDLL